MRRTLLGIGLERFGVILGRAHDPLRPFGEADRFVESLVERFGERELERLHGQRRTVVDDLAPPARGSAAAAGPVRPLR